MADAQGCSSQNWAAIVTGASGVITTVMAYFRGRLWKINHTKRLERRIEELEARNYAEDRREEIKEVLIELLNGGKLT